MSARLMSLQVQAAQGGITSLCLCPRSHLLLATASDGSWKALDVHQAGKCISSKMLPQSLRCCLSDGHTAMAGSSNGQVSTVLS